jgi:hypothetical protein
MHSMRTKPLVFHEPPGSKHWRATAYLLAAHFELGVQLGVREPCVLDVQLVPVQGRLLDMADLLLALDGRIALLELWVEGFLIGHGCSDSRASSDQERLLLAAGVEQGKERGRNGLPQACASELRE